MRDVALLRALDAASKRQADMARKDQRAAGGAVVQHLAAADARLLRGGILREIPVRVIDLQEVVPHVADKGRTFAFTFELEEHVPRRVAGRGIDLDKL